jgi:hypothetical protein
MAKGSKRGRPFKHGGYSLMVRAGEVPERMTKVRAYLSGVRAGLVRDVAGQEEAMTTAQGVLVDRAISLLGVLRTIEESLSEKGIMQGSALSPILRENYISYNNTLRLTLAALGINRREGDKVIDLDTYLGAAHESAKKTVRDAQGGPIVAPDGEGNG